MKAHTKGSILVALAIVALIGSGAAVSRGEGDAQWSKALEARSEALNERYGLGAYAPVARGSETTSEPSWMRALRLRSEALNRIYGLGVWEFKKSPAPLGDEPAWLLALRIRSEALNQQYKLGVYAPGS
ncbi:MAG TPA: hypothetical protein VJ807_07185 [Gaiellaceae bacterium]|nr:hypothetical protein [Gaiellaceae bacterium]